ncbi:unnamed protein product [Brassica rapa subsp. trilocularis]
MNLSFLRKTIPVDFYDFPGLSLEVVTQVTSGWYRLSALISTRTTRQLQPLFPRSFIWSWRTHDRYMDCIKIMHINFLTYTCIHYVFCSFVRI